MKIPNIFTVIAKSNIGQKVYKKMLNPSKDAFWNTTMPLIETTFCTSVYIASTAMQKNIDPESKKAMQIQNILNWGFSILIAGALNKGVQKMGKNIVKGIKPELMIDGHKVINAINVGLPIAVTCLVNRFLVATAIVPVSSKIRDSLKKKKEASLCLKA